MELNEYWSAQAVEEYKGYLYEKKDDGLKNSMCYAITECCI